MAREAITKWEVNESSNKMLFVNDLYAASEEHSGYRTIHKYGHNLDINSAFETIWNIGGTYSYLGGATILKISSDDTKDDNVGGVGARTVLVQGLDANYKEIEETVELDGQDAVNTTKQYLRVYRMIVQTVGSEGDNAGTIYAGTGAVLSGVPANKYASIPEGYNQTMMAVYTVPADTTAYMTQFYCSPDSQASFQVQLHTRDENGIQRVRNQLHAFQSVGNFQYKPYLKITEKTDIEIRASVGTANTEFGGGFSLILVDNIEPNIRT